MAENSKIEWTDHTFNPWIGCTKVGPGCDNCYAEAREAKRFHRVQWGPGKPRHRTKTWSDPVKWNAAHEAFFAAHGRRQRVFCASLADVFDNEVPKEWRRDLFQLIAETPNLDWLLLTKRIGNAKRMMDEIAWNPSGPGPCTEWQPMPNVWLGATIVNQEEADRDIPKLLATPAAVRFLSMEPLLGPVDLGAYLDGEETDYAATGKCTGYRPPVDWVIAGGESGPAARPLHPNWARSLRDQCDAAGVPFLFKQWGEFTAGEPACHPGYPDDKESPWRLDQRGQRWNDPQESLGNMAPLKFLKVGKKIAGRLLDDVTHDGFPS